MKTQPLYPRRQPPSTLRLLWYFTLACLSFAAVIVITSCAELPLTIEVQGEHGNYSYSAKRGVGIQLDATK